MKSFIFLWREQTGMQRQMGDLPHTTELFAKNSPLEVGISSEGF